MASIKARKWVDENGKSQSRVDVTITRKGSRRQTKTFRTHGAAQRWARLVEAEIEMGAFKSTAMAERMTLADAMRRFVEEELPRMKSQEPDKSKVRMIAPHLGKYPLIAIDNQVLYDYQKKRLSMRALNARRYKDGRTELVKLRRKISGTTVRHELLLISRVISCAIKKWGVHLPAGNPVRLIELPPVGKGRDRRLVADEEARLLSALDSKRIQRGPCNPYMRALTIFAIETASRRGEIVRVLWRDVDLKNRTATLRDTKNGEDRSIGLSTRAVEALMSLPRPKDARVFPLTSNAVRMAWYRALRRAGIQGLRFHDLRHEATSRLAVKFNGDVMAMSAMTGHKSLQMLKRYTHLRADELARRLG